MADILGYVNQGKPLDGEVWTIEVGGSKQKWVLHENLLCTSSAFFRSAVKKEWDHDRMRTIPMPDDEVDVFQVYVQWLYQAKILVQQHNEDPKSSRELHTLIKCYIFGEKIQDVVFQNVTIDSIFACVHREKDGTKWFPTDADTVYDGTPEGSPLRTLIVDMFAYHGQQGWLEEQRNVDFLVDLAKKLLDVRERPLGLSPVSRDTSSVYHKPAQEVVTQDPSSEQTTESTINRGEETTTRTRYRT
ncbi:hypothetical protein LTR78_007424 [Recurvomyces mirabilis]|uniref:BTB domain-containing protein n=1 Tax=Recurvomyces mirabilis TaxID=574656 RepID=A0AAE0TRT7_9PEZI|nr:hypothetical protein LTR78_007424 [Recurvomyces mirabilis]KAK5160067.1 hypothetical protein LTS14_002173 [Recurvomyces mirabilis]